MAPPPVTFVSAGSIIIPASGTSGIAAPYPSSILVSGISNPVVSIQIQLNELTHTFPDDIDILLESPAGQKMIIMSDAGGTSDVVNITLTLEDSAATLLPDSGPLISGSFMPTNYGFAVDNFPPPAPIPPYSSPATTGSATLNGTFLTGLPGSLNGLWNLWIRDDGPNDIGTLASWQITFFFSDIPCLYKDTLVHTINGKKQIKDIKAGDSVIDYKGNSVEVEYNIVLPEAKKFTLIPKNSLGDSKPSMNLYIRKEHPILLDGKEVLPGKISDKMKVMKKAETIYSLCTKERTFVKMNNVDVATWGKEDWENKRNTKYSKQ